MSSGAGLEEQDYNNKLKGKWPLIATGASATS